MNRFKKNSILIALLTIVILFLVLKDDLDTVIDLLQNANIFYLILACLFQFAMIFFESLAFDKIIKSYKSKHPFKKTFELTLMTKFFNGITPFSTGGQPMQVYFLNKDGFRVTKATNIIMQNFILYQLALVTVGTIALLINSINNYFNQTPILKYLVTIGFIINTLVMVILFVISFSKKVNEIIVNTVINILSKFKIVKDKDTQKEKWMERCNDFHEGATYIKEHKLLCLKGYIYNIIGLICSYAIPYFVVKSLDITTSVNLLSMIVASSYVLIIGSFIPIPGATGGIEFGFLQFFGNFITGSLLNATLLIWRTITYYLPMIIGAVTLNLRKEKK